ncbi:hypothetical protein V8C26DRAFT_376697 [Trichoderma gracile]
MPTCANLCCVQDFSLCSFEVARCLVDERSLPHGPFPARAVDSHGLFWYRRKNNMVIDLGWYHVPGSPIFWELCLPGMHVGYTYPTRRMQACMQASGASRHKQNVTWRLPSTLPGLTHPHLIKNINRYRGWGEAEPILVSTQANGVCETGAGSFQPHGRTWGSVCCCSPGELDCAVETCCLKPWRRPTRLCLDATCKADAKNLLACSLGLFV